MRGIKKLLILTVILALALSQAAVSFGEETGAGAGLKQPPAVHEGKEVTAEKDFAVDVVLGVYYNYVWRGMLQHSGIAMQPEVTFTVLELLSLNIWNDFNPAAKTGWFETDLTLGYVLPIMPKNWHGKVGAILYNTRDPWSPFFDVFLNIGVNVGIDIDMTGYVGTADPEGKLAYVEAMLSKPIDLTKKVVLTPALTVGDNFVHNLYAQMTLPLNYKPYDFFCVGVKFVGIAGTVMPVVRPTGWMGYAGVNLSAFF